MTVAQGFSPASLCKAKNLPYGKNRTLTVALIPRKQLCFLLKVLHSALQIKLK